MGPSSRTIGLGVAAALVLTLAGCAEDPVFPIAAWTLEAGTRRPPVAIELPSHVESLIERPPTTYTLRARVELPPPFRGKVLTFAIPHLDALAKLRGNGENLTPLEDGATDVYRKIEPYRFRIPAALSEQGTVAFELEVKDRWPGGAWIDSVPRLSATLQGDAALLRMRAVNRAMGQFGFWAIFPAALTQAILFFVSRQSSYAWFAVAGLCVSAYPAFSLGITQTVFGVNDIAIMAALMSLGAYASTRSTYDQCGLGRPPRILGYLVVMALAANGFGFVSGHVPFIEAALTLAVLIGKVACDLRAVLAIRKRGHPKVEVWLGSLTGPVALTLGLGDLSVLTGAGDYLGGYRLAPFAIGGMVLTQSIGLGLGYFASLDGIKQELLARLGLLENRTVEAQRLNEELRRQIAGRASELANVLARAPKSSDAPFTLAAGSLVLGRYRVIGFLGSGAVGNVYEVERQSDGRRVALKLLKTRGDALSLARFAREAQVACQVHDPNVISVFDIDVAADGFLFLVMELMKGKTLRDEKTRFGDVPWAVAILAQVASGLAAIHAIGAVHRDLKPANILLAGEDAFDRGGDPDGRGERARGREGGVKIADFGLSSLAKPDGGGEPASADWDDSGESASQTGHRGGTPLYMAPEAVIDTLTAGPPADIFSFGVMAYELLAGEPPQGNLPIAYLLQAVPDTKIAPLEARAPGLSPALARCIHACMRLDPSLRPTAAQLRAAFAGTEVFDRLARAFLPT